MKSLASISILFALVGLIALPAQGSVITWGAVDATDAISDISTAGTTVFAGNAGHTVDQTVNGVTFAALGTDPLGISVLNVLSGTVVGFTIEDPIYKMLNTMSVGGGDGVTTVTLSDLIVGETYQVQVFAADLRSTSAGRVMRYGDGEGGGIGNYVDLLGGCDPSDGMGQNVIGTFTADATTQLLTMEPQGFGNSFINAYQVRMLPVPEPSTFIMLFCLGTVGLLGYFRRRNK